jgi:hypothetical protein
MKWLNFIDEVYLINLLKRDDRLLESVKILEEYHIPYKRISAIEKPNGAEGLRDTMNEIFNDSIKKGHSNILVLEDDFKPVVDIIWFNETLNNAVEQLPENYHCCFLGGQPTGGFSSFFSPNLLPVIKFFSTQSVIYSAQCIKEILARGMGFPIDNWLVDEIEPMGHCYCTYPMLTTQRAGVSDIGKTFIDWNVFMQPKFEQELNKMRARC